MRNKLLYCLLVIGLLLPTGVAADGDVILDLQGVVWTDGDRYAVVDAGGGEYAPLEGAVHLEDGLWIEAGATNLVTNPSFENYPTAFFTSVGYFSRTLVSGIHGNYALQLYKTSLPGTNAPYLRTNSNSISVDGSKTYKFMLYARETSDYSVYARVYWYDASISLITYEEFSIYGDNWNAYEFLTTSPTAAAYARLYFAMHVDSALGSSLVIDSVQFSDIITYIDGDLGPGYTWTGTAHASTSERLTTTVSISPALSALSGNETWSARIQYTPQYSSTADWPDEAILLDMRGFSDNNRLYVAYADSDDRYHVYLNGADRMQSSARSWEAGAPLDLWLSLDFGGTARLIENGSEIAAYNIAALTPPTGLISGTLGSDVFGVNHANALYTEFALLDHAVTVAETSGYAGHFVVDNPTSGDDVQLLEGLYSYWTLDENGGVRYDSRDGEHLTDNNTVLTTTGQINAAALFNATNSEHLSYALQHTPDAWTWAGWGRLDQVTTTNTLLNARDFDLVYTPTTGLYLNLVGTPLLHLPGSITSTWEHVAVWYDGAGIMGVRQNGVRYTIPYSLPYSHDSALRFGYNGYDYLTGALDEWGVWERVLNAAELDELETPTGYSEFEAAGILAATPTPTVTATPVPERQLFLPFVARGYEYTEPFEYPTPTPENPYLGVDYSGDTSWTDWAEMIEAFFAPLFIQVEAGHTGLEELRGDVCGAGFEDTAGFLPGNSPDDPVEVSLGEDPTVLDVSYAMGISLGRPFGYIRAFYDWLPAINNSYNVLGMNFFVMLMYFMTAGVIWVVFVIVVTYSMYFIRTVIQAAIQIYELIPLKAT